MRRKVQSQWEFTDLIIEKNPKRKVFSISELNHGIGLTLQAQYGRIFVTGEVTNLRRQSSGHIYFSLKDEQSQLSCVLFRGAQVTDRDAVEEGQKLILEGDLTVYEPRGQYQLIVRGIELCGQGALQRAFEQLKRRLDAEGLFDARRKRPILPHPQRIGLITSPTGAAIRDVLHVVERRFAGLEIILAPCRVQGKEAAGEITRAIDSLNEWHVSGGKLDLILITRGGGSLEDLWVFNEEPVARAVAESTLPVVSAIGHEIDFTICDFVADLRAATPSAAAELLTQGMYDCRTSVEESARRIRRRLLQSMADFHETCSRLEQRLIRNHPQRRLEADSQRLDELEVSLSRRVRSQLSALQTRLQSARLKLAAVRPSAQLRQRREALSHRKQDLHRAVVARLESCHRRLQQARTRLHLLSPANVLQRGYSITFDADTGSVIRSHKEIQPGQSLQTRVQDGTFTSQVPDKPDESSAQ